MLLGEVQASEAQSHQDIPRPLVSLKSILPVTDSGDDPAETKHEAAEAHAHGARRAPHESPSLSRKHLHLPEPGGKQTYKRCTSGLDLG